MCPSVLPHPLAFLCEWYSPFKKALVISQCSVSFQQSAAGSTFHRGSAGALMHTQTHSCCYRTLRDTHTGMLAHWHTLTTHTQPLKRTLLPANTHFPWAGRLSLRERTNCSEDLTWLSHKTKREKEQSEQGKKKEEFIWGHLPSQEMVNLSVWHLVWIPLSSSGKNPENDGWQQAACPAHRWGHSVSQPGGDQPAVRAERHQPQTGRAGSDGLFCQRAWDPAAQPQW